MAGGPVSSRVSEVLRCFELSPAALRAPREALARPPMPEAGEVVLITGPSGSGKSSLLAVYRRLLGGRAVEPAPAALAEETAVAAVDLLGDVALEEAVALLARVGLAEARSLALPPARLSAGQRWRLALAVALQRCRDLERSAARSAPATLLCDEFAAVLDRVTAAAVAHVLRREVSRPGATLAAVMATAHEDLAGALEPDVLITCDFGTARVERRRGRRGRRRTRGSS